MEAQKHFIAIATEQIEIFEQCCSEKCLRFAKVPDECTAIVMYVVYENLTHRLFTLGVCFAEAISRRNNS